MFSLDGGERMSIYCFPRFGGECDGGCVSCAFLYGGNITRDTSIIHNLLCRSSNGVEIGFVVVGCVMLLLASSIVALGQSA